MGRINHLVTVVAPDAHTRNIRITGVGDADHARDALVGHGRGRFRTDRSDGNVGEGQLHATFCGGWGVNGLGKGTPTARDGERDAGILLVDNTVAVHPLNHALPFVGRTRFHEDDVAVLIGQIVPVIGSVADVVKVKAPVGNIGRKAALRE